jgi:hypothetical protein
MLWFSYVSSEERHVRVKARLKGRKSPVGATPLYGVKKVIRQLPDYNGSRGCE